MPRYIGKEMGRVDGVAKVTGRAKYAAEHPAPNSKQRLQRFARLPGAAGAEFAPFAAGLTRMQQLLGAHFAPAQLMEAA